MSRAVPMDEWTDDGTGKVPVFFDGRRRLVDPLHDFVESITATKRDGTSEAGYRSAVDAVTYALLGWLKYLDANRKSLWDATDALLVAYRDESLGDVLQSPRGKKDKRLGQRTVNTNLRSIYRFYAWAQREANLCTELIGPRAPDLRALRIADALGQWKAQARQRQRLSKVLPARFGAGKWQATLHERGRKEEAD